VPTAQEKTLLIDALTVAMDNGRISYPEIQVLLGELETFEHELTATGRDRYTAPEGFHDDAVISLALAWRGISSHRPLIIAGASTKKQAEGSLDYMLKHYFTRIN
jgi:hypothetical protein